MQCAPVRFPKANLSAGVFLEVLSTLPLQSQMDPLPKTKSSPTLPILFIYPLPNIPNISLIIQCGFKVSFYIAL
jgi:hypothetical protein